MVSSPILPRSTGLLAAGGLLWVLASTTCIVQPALGHPPSRDSLDTLDARLAVQPHDGAARLGRGQLRLELGDLAGAESDMAMALSIDPDSPAARLHLARLYVEMNRPQDAIEAATRYLDSTSESGPRSLLLAWIIRSRAHQANGDLSAALVDLERALQSRRRPPPELFLEKAEILRLILESQSGQVGQDELRLALLGTLDEGIAALGPLPSLQLPAIELELQRGRGIQAVRRLDTLILQADRKDYWLARRAAIADQFDLGPTGIRSEADRSQSFRLSGAILPSSPVEARPQNSPQLSRGPYLQLATDSSIVVRWRTDLESTSRVAWGSAVGELDSEVVDPTLVTEHEVTVSGLEAATCYVYSVGTETETLAGDDAEHLICTAPSREATLRVWIIGDSGTGNSDAADVRDAYLGYFSDPRPDVWLMLGDNAYPSGTDEDYQEAVFDMYPTILAHAAVWPSFGNHDAVSSNSATQTGPYFDSFTLPTQGEAGGMMSGTEAYYSFNHGPVHFICLDSAGSNTPTTAMIDWLVADLVSTDRPWKIVYFHHPPYSKGSHDSDDPSSSGGRLTAMREIIVPILEDHGVDLVLSGHSHSYERSVLIDGHYGTSDTLIPPMIVDGGDGSPQGDGAYRKLPGPHNGTLYSVVGSSGKTSGGPLDHPIMHVSLNHLGSMVAEVGEDFLQGIFINDLGVREDLFRLELLPTEVFEDGFETGDTSRWFTE